jgi:hypothetical protein
MRKFVPPRRRAISRRIVVRTESKKNSEIKLFFYYHWQKILGGIIVCLVGYLLFFFNISPIKRVTFTQDTITTLEYTELLDTVSQELIWKWYYKQKYSKRNSFITTIKKQFPIVKSLSPISFNEWTLNINITYNSPDFVAETSDNSLWYVYRNWFIPYVSWSILWESGMVIWVTILQEWIQQLSWWVFWKIWSQDLVKVINQINFLPKDGMKITYYPWWEKLKVISWNWTFIISLDSSFLSKTFTKRKDLIPYMPRETPYSADISDPDRVIIKQ